MRSFNIPVVVKNVNNKLRQLGFPIMSLRSSQLLGNLAKQGLYNDTCVCHWMARDGVIANASGGVTSWLNVAPSKVTLNKNLEQTTAANQPVWLLHDGGLAGQYGYTDGSTNTQFTTPDSVATSIAGSFEMVVRVAMNDWTPSALGLFIAKSASASRGYRLGVAPGGNLRLLTSPDGTTDRSSLSTVVAPFIDGQTYWVRATKNVSTGDVNFYWTNDQVTEPTNWIQLGATVASNAENNFDNAALLTLSGDNDGGSNIAGKIYRAILKNGIGGTTAFDFNPATYTSGVTFTDSSVNAATITLNGGATIVTVSGLYFDGSNDSLVTGSFGLTQPMTRYVVIKQVSWTASDELYDGLTASGWAIRQFSSSPTVGVLSSGAGGPTSALLTLQTHGVIMDTYTAGTASLRINRNPATSSSPGAPNANGICLGGKADGTNMGNSVIVEALVYNVAHNTAQQDAVINYLMTKYNL